MPAPSTCTVSGTLYGPTATPVEGARIKVYVTSAFTDPNGNYIPEGLLASTTSDAAGAWSLAVIRTATINQSVTFQFEYPLGNNQSASVKYAAVIPNAATANFADLVDLDSGTAAVTASLTTDNLSEGVLNLYFTQARARAALSATSPITYDSSTGVISSTGLVTTSRSISTTAPLTGGGDLSANRTIAMPAAASGTDGYLSGTDWSTFNNKQAGPLTGDVTTSGAAATIGNDTVSNAKLANMAQSTIKGRAAGAGTGDPTDLTATQATAILDAMVGDSGSGGTKGLVPAPASGDAAAGKFLKADGTFAVPTGSGITALTGDVTASGSGSQAATIPNNTVTYAKMQDVSATDKLLGRSSSGAGDVEEIACTAAGRALLDDAAASDQRTTLGLGTIATQNANNVTITGGAVSGITDLAIADGGTGASTKAAAFDALSPMTSSGDIIYGGASGTGTRLAKGSDGQVLTLASGVPSWAAAAGGSAPDCYLRLSGGNGYGSTNNKIRRFSNTVASNGTDFTYADSATNGMSITINVAGVYAITYSDWRSGANGVHGLSCNSNQLTTAIDGGITDAHHLVMTYDLGSLGSNSCSYTGRFAVNDVIRAHTDGTTADTATSRVKFIITRVA